MERRYIQYILYIYMLSKVGAAIAQPALDTESFWERFLCGDGVMSSSLCHVGRGHQCPSTPSIAVLMFSPDVCFY